MKRQKILVDVRQAMAETAFGSTERDDALARLRRKHLLSTEALRRACLFTPGVNYWQK